MKVTGITAEFNPLHKGHEYFMEETRRKTGAGALVVAMSGNFVQRGEPAITSKHERAKTALDAGADLVIEIPTLFCLGNASQYASASVCLLEACGASFIAFGSESGSADLITEAARELRNHNEYIAEEISALTKEGLSYPAARAKAFSNAMNSCKEVNNPKYIAEDLLGVLERPNDILALEYVLNMSNAEALAIKRLGASYEEPGITEDEFQSASAIRNAVIDALNEGSDISSVMDNIGSYLPESTRQMLLNSDIAKPDDCMELLKYALLSTDASEIEDCPSAGEGLANLLKDGAKDAVSYDDLIMHAKSKRYTYSRISRLCMQLLLGISRSRYPYKNPGYIRILGFSNAGRELISEIKEREDLPVITNINKESGMLGREAADMLKLDVHATDIYNLISGRDQSAGSDHRLMSVMK